MLECYGVSCPKCRWTTTAVQTARTNAVAADAVIHHAQLVPWQGFGYATGYAWEPVSEGFLLWHVYLAYYQYIPPTTMRMKILVALSASSFSCLAAVLLILYSLASYPSYHHVPHRKTSSTLPIVRPATTPVLNQFHRTHNCQPLSLIPPSSVL